MNNEEIKSLINEYLELEDIIENENLSSIERHLLLKKTDIKNKIDTFIKDDSISIKIIDILKELKKHIEWMDTMHMDHLDSDLQKDSRKLKKYINDTTVISNTPLSEFIQNLEESIKRLISLQRKLDKTKDKEKIDLESSLEYLSKMINQQFAKIINNGTNDTLKSHISALPEFTFRDYTHTMKKDISKCVINYFKAKNTLEQGAIEDENTAKPTGRFPFYWPKMFNMKLR